MAHPEILTRLEAYRSMSQQMQSARLSGILDQLAMALARQAAAEDDERELGSEKCAQRSTLDTHPNFRTPVASLTKSPSVGGMQKLMDFWSSMSSRMLPCPEPHSWDGRELLAYEMRRMQGSSTPSSARI